MPRRSTAARSVHPAWREIAVGRLSTPVGVLQIATAGSSLLYVGWLRPRSRKPFERWLCDRLTTARPTPALRAALKQLREYFAGRRTEFDLPVDFVGTRFQEKVWRIVSRIPFGETLSYGAVAAAVGDREGARAVGAAVGANPISIVIPCHRVVGADGSLTGYGGGMRAKVWLLRHEGTLLA
jgi:methylated-DNA-[protein]-cysteine S-methyltransferase